MFRAGGVCGDERQVDICLGHAGQLDLGLFGSLFESLHRHLVAGQVDAVFFLKLFYKVVDQSLVEVVAAQSVVAGSCQNFLYAVAHLDDGYIEGTAAQVVYHDLLIGFFIDAVSQRSSCRLVDDSLYIQASNLACILGCLTLCIGEVCRNSDDRLGDRLAQVSLRVRFELLQDHRGNFLWGVGFAVDGNFIVGAHLTLDRADGAVCVGDSLTFCNLADHALAGLGERNNRWCGARAFRVRNNNRLAAFHNGYAGVCST